jgi:hypothetical protein
MLRAMFLIALLLAAAPEPVLLSQKAQLKDLCAALNVQLAAGDLDPAQAVSARREALVRREEAAARWYEIEIPSKGFTLGRYREKDHLLELDGSRPLRAIDGMLSLDIDGTDDVAFEATSEQVTAWNAEKKGGTLRLVVVFQPSGDRCAGSPAAESWRIAGKARAWRLQGETVVVAASDGEGEPVGGGPRKLQVEKVSLESELNAPDDEGRSRLGPARAQLDKCAANAQHGGSLVLGFDLRAGRIADPQVLIDSLHDERTAACVAKAVQGVAMSGSGHGTASIDLQ